jgi:hypothetical protein
VYRSKRKLLKESKQIRSITRQRKYELHAAVCYKIPEHYCKGIADPKIDVTCMHLTKTVCYDLGKNKNKILNIPYTNYSNMYNIYNQY